MLGPRGGLLPLFQEYRDIFIFVNSLLDVVYESCKIIHALFVPLGWDLGPGDSVHVPAFACESTRRWMSVLDSCACVH